MFKVSFLQYKTHHHGLLQWFSSSKFGKVELPSGDVVVLVAGSPNESPFRGKKISFCNLSYSYEPDLDRGREQEEIDALVGN